MPDRRTCCRPAHGPPGALAVTRRPREAYLALSSPGKGMSGSPLLAGPLGSAVAELQCRRTLKRWAAAPKHRMSISHADASLPPWPPGPCGGLPLAARPAAPHPTAAASSPTTVRHGGRDRCRGERFGALPDGILRRGVNSSPLVNDPQAQSNLGYALGVLRARWWMLAVAVMVCIGAALALAVTAKKQYEATATVVVRKAGLSSAAIGATSRRPAPILCATLPRRHCSSNPARSPRGSSERSGFISPRMPLEAKVSVAAEQNADVLDISARDANPAVAAKLANTDVEGLEKVRLASRSSTSRCASRPTTRPSGKERRSCASAWPGFPRRALSAAH